MKEFLQLKAFIFLASVVVVALAAPESCENECKNPGIRREWRSLGFNDQKAFADAIKCSLHWHLLSWHRLFLNTLENILRSECHYTGHLPFWDWTLGDYHDIKHSYLFNADPEVGFGAFPGPETNYTVTTGAFRNLIRAYPYTHRGQRNYTLRPFAYDPLLQANTTQTLEEWKKLVTGSVGNYTSFQYSVDGVRGEGVHIATHLSIGGDVAALSYSPNDVIFFLLHCQLDRLWAAWQGYSPQNRYAIGGGLTQDLLHYDTYPVGTGTPVTLDTVILLSNLAPNTKVKELMDTKGGVLCYEYEITGSTYM
ncbi:uncharacterized protein EI90DRAFT_3032640 [Cantharellus anzutake]|uniref:uncharacterized protein n=1 Tax=Cantharellus anzutake TaxID=1750568 RepID=UPI00190698BC|nr:uncharacterized protein EI90DRAFT_3032640 [Cantharellus anzutake]KAF8342255.1 hypothetical protein EI90DRAFT_3032640 [Cantharellus anzutake]